MQSNAEAHVTRRNFVRSWLENWAEWQTADARVRVGERRLQLLRTLPGPRQNPVCCRRHLRTRARTLHSCRGPRLRRSRPGCWQSDAQAEAALRALGSNPEAVASPDVGEMACLLPSSLMPMSTGYRTSRQLTRQQMRRLATSRSPSGTRLEGSGRRFQHRPAAPTRRCERHRARCLR